MHELRINVFVFVHSVARFERVFTDDDNHQGHWQRLSPRFGRRSRCVSIQLYLDTCLQLKQIKNVTAMRAAEIADIFEGNLPSDSKLRYQIEHFEPDSVHRNRSRQFEGRKHQEKTSTEK